MVLQMHSLESIRIYMGIQLRGANIGMAQKFLHHPQIRATREQMCGEGMAQCMGVNMSQATGLRYLCNALPQNDPVNGLARPG